MKEKLEQGIRAFSELSENEIAEGLDYFNLKNFKKGDHLISAGKTCDWVAFVISGIIRNYYISSNDEEVTYCLTFPNNYISAYSSFISGKKTFENIHAITDVKVLVLKKKDLLNLISRSKGWLKFSNHFAEQSYILMENRLISIQMESAEKRYKDLLKESPEFLEKVPLKYIASYLGITPRHLSRLRKDFPA